MTGTPRVVVILLVEDDAGDVLLLREALADARVVNDLHVLGDGEKAMAFLRRLPPYENAPRPDLVLLDLNLPRKNGHEVLQEMKADPELRAIPVVILTTSDSEADIALAYEHYANSYVTKKSNLDEFLDLVRKLDEFWLQIVRLPPPGGAAPPKKGLP